jgi:hypothetical protein
VELVELGTLHLVYRSLESVDHDGGTQFYGVMEGAITGERLQGTIELTNLARRRPDNVNTPTLRGMLTTDDGEQIWLELDGLATLRPADGARVFVTACRFLAGSSRFAWLNTVVGVLEGVLDTQTGGAHGRMFECRPTLA